jgi:hypothetical protein
MLLQIKKPHKQKLPLWFVCLNAGLLARTLYPYGRSCDRLLRSEFSLLFLSPTANAELTPKIHMLLIKPSTKSTSKFSPKRNSPQRNQNLVTNLPSKHKIRPEFLTSFLCSIFLADHFPSSPLSVFPCHQSNFTSTTSSHCLATSRAANFSDSSFSRVFSSLFLDLHQSSRYFTSSFMQKFKPLDSLKLSRTAKNIVLPYPQLLPTQFTYSYFHCWTYFHQLVF